MGFFSNILNLDQTRKAIKQYNTRIEENGWCLRALERKVNQKFIGLGSLAPAGYLMLNRKLVDHYSPFVLTTYATTLASIPILLLTLPTLFHQEWSAISGIGWAAMMWVTVVPVFVSWSLWNWVLRHLLLQQVAPLLFIVPVVSGIAAWLVLDESIVFGQIAGAAIILLGLTVNGHATSRPRV